MATSTVWAVISPDDRGGVEVEYFSTRPNTPDIGGEPGNWPPTYQVFEGNIDGGDSILVGRNP